MSKWDPTQYLTFGNERLQPALDLLARIPLKAPKTIVDLGCGPGNVTGFLMERWPDANVSGVDGSSEMLERARAEHPQVSWVQGDMNTWAPESPVDLIYSNAALHWLDDHASVFPRIMSLVTKGGYLAAQMPRNWFAPSHTVITEVVKDGPWRETLEPLIRPNPTGGPEDYYEILTPHTSSLALWETEYCQILEGENPVAEFVKGSQLKRFLDALDEPLRTQFWETYCEGILAAYPKRADGRTLFPFRRLFIVAGK